MLKASSLIETIFATVIISIALLVGSSVYSKIISSAVSVREIRINEEVNAIYNSVKQNRAVLEEVYEFEGFKILSDTVGEALSRLYELRLSAIYDKDTLVKKYMIYEND